LTYTFFNTTQVIEMLRIEFKKASDRTIFICTREDETSTWMESSEFFVAHDLAHYVIEKGLSFKHGFYGLIEQGMNITDFEKKQKFNPREMPVETFYAELLVNLLMTELSDKRQMDNFQKTFNDVCLQSKLPILEIDPDVLQNMRSELADLVTHWKSIPSKKSLNLTF
jgi:hypothetical protein